MSSPSLGRPSPRIRAIARQLLSPVVRLFFRPSLRGTENLPADRPFLLVANHSAGMAVAEIFSFAALYLEQQGDRACLAGFAHPVGFKYWPVTVLHREVGSIPSTYEAAHTALAQGVPILVFPGGDHESLRPIWQANRVDFGGRRGFLRIAVRAGVPIVPMGIWGSHYTAPMLLRGKWIANLLVAPRVLLGVKRWGISLLGVIGALLIATLPLPVPLRAALVWLWLGTPLVLLPIVPWTIRMSIGQPIAVEALADSEEALARVEAAVHAQLERARRG